MGYLLLLAHGIICSLFVTHSLRWGVHLAPYALVALSGLYVLFGSGDLEPPRYLFLAGLLMLLHIVALETCAQERNAAARSKDRPQTRG